MLVVLLLIAVIVSFAVLNAGIGGRDPRLETEARRLTAVLELAAESAVIQSRELGLVLDEDGYQFVRLDNGEWLPAADDADRVLRAHGLPEDIHVEWIADGLPGERQPGGGKEDDHRPAILLLSSGEITPFRMTMTWRDDPGNGWLLEGELTGALRLSHGEEPNP